MSPKPETLPIIDISPFLPTSDPETRAGRGACAQALADACSKYGFFYLTNHSIPSSLTDEVLSLARSFFLSTPESEKRSIARKDPPDGDGARGYQVLRENITQGQRDLQEAIDFYRPVDQNETVPSTQGEGKANNEGAAVQWLTGRNRWPSKPAAFRRIYEEYIERMMELGTAVVEAMGVALELDDPNYFVGKTRKSFWVLRAIGYPPMPKQQNNGNENGDANGQPNGADGDSNVQSEEPQGEVSCGAHTDYGCLTLLMADPTPGALQVQTREGPWINADPIPGAYVVNIGDMMEIWTNGLWKSTWHRVLHRGEGFRVSVPFFFEPDYDAKVEPLRECVVASPTGKKMYDSVVYGEHLLAKVRGNFTAPSDEPLKRDAP